MLSVLCPCYNEAAVLPLFFERVISVLEKLGEPFEIVCVNDGSSDDTLKILKAKVDGDARVHVLNLSRNFGKEAALTAALDFCKGDCVVPLDADLQDPPELIGEMLSKWREGYDVVLAHRSQRSEGFIRRLPADLFSWVQSKIFHPAMIKNVGDFRLMDRRVVEVITKQLRENCRFMRGLLSWPGFKTCVVDYTRPARADGKSKYNIWRLWMYAMDGLVSFSTALLTIWLYIGSVVASCAFLYGLYIFARKLIFGIDIPGYASLSCLILLFGGLQLLGVGILGEYLGRTYLEAKHRPIYIVRDVYERKGGAENGDAAR